MGADLTDKRRFFLFIRVYPLNPRAKHLRSIFMLNYATERCKANSLIFEPCQKRETINEKLKTIRLSIVFS